MRVQIDVVMETSFKNLSKVGRVIHSLVRVCSEIVEIGFEYVLKIMKCEGHSSLECLSYIHKFHLMLVLGINLNLVIPENPSIKEKTLIPTHSSRILSMKGVKKLSLRQALFRSQKSMHTWMFPFFLFTGMGLDTHSVKGTRYIKPMLSSFLPMP
jgi:hypothetical protein